jgi:hypothetical protein
MGETFYRRMFLVSALWNLVGGAVLVLFMPQVFALSNVPVPEPRVWYYCWIALFVTFGIGILSVYRDMYANRAFVPIGIIGKVSFSVIYVWYYFARPGEVPAFVLIGVVGDLIFSALYGAFLRSTAGGQRRPAAG